MAQKKKNQPYDIVIIGSGPGGVRAAVQAAKLGKKVAIVEKTPNQLGGAWIHTGTIPSKTLRESIDTIHSIRFHVGSEWVDRIVNDLSPDAVFGRAFNVASEEEKVVREFLRRNDVEVITGHGLLENDHQVRVLTPDGSPLLLDTQYIVLATGSKPRRPTDIPFDGWRVVDSDDILQLGFVPRQMTIYGAGVIGCEYACIFKGLGTDVTIIDGRNEVMRTIDQEVAKELRNIMTDQGIKFKMGLTLQDVKVDGPTVNLTLSSGDTEQTDLLFFAAGRVSSTAKLGLERVGIDMAERGTLKVNQHFQTNIPNIYAVGDAIGAPALAATSTEQGRYAAAHAFGECEGREFPKIFPVGIYTIPELSSIGKSEEELIAEKTPYEVGRANFKEVTRGYIRGDNKGMLKMLVCPKTLQILGLHIIGPDACNLIHTGLGFMLYNGTVIDIVDKMIFNYPTLAETYRIAAFNALNKIFSDGVFIQPKSKKAA